jgi:hypothetical protein
VAGFTGFDVLGDTGLASMGAADDFAVGAIFEFLAGVGLHGLNYSTGFRTGNVPSSPGFKKQKSEVARNSWLMLGFGRPREGMRPKARQAQTVKMENRK